MTQTQTRSSGNGKSAGKHGPGAMEVPLPQVHVVNLTIRGTSPLLVNKKPKDTIGNKPRKKERNDAYWEEQWRLKRHLLDPSTGEPIDVGDTAEGYTGHDGFPAGGILRGLGDANWAAHGKKGGGKPAVLRAVQINPGHHLIPIMGPDGPFGDGTDQGAPRMQYDTAVPQSAPELIVRPAYDDWWMDLEIHVVTNVMETQQVLSLLRAVGASQGVGAWRPEKGGPHGRFDIDPSQPIQMREMAGETITIERSAK